VESIMMKRVLAAAVVAAPVFVVGGTVGASPAVAAPSSPGATVDRGAAESVHEPTVRCEWRRRYGDWCRYCYRYGKWRLDYCDDDWDDWDDDRWD
jgi:hypothetical protein